jgi:hypothetical protein
MREGDIEALRSKLRDEGRPMKSQTMITEKERIYFAVKKEKNKERIRITDRHDH